MKRRILVILTLALLASLLFSQLAWAQEMGKAFKVGAADVTVFAPRTVWEGTNAHVIIKFGNPGSQSIKDMKATLALPKGDEGRFSYKGKTELALPELKAGETKYLAFTYISPVKGKELKNYTAVVTVSVGEAKGTYNWTFSVRPGARFRQNTPEIVSTIMWVTIGMVVFWFLVFKLYFNRSWKLIP
ncbi:MAG: hypothetical protein M1553_12835 [Firmicutes bacterium]|nr:hypothetical protein [Bacillota bacterium]